MTTWAVAFLAHSSAWLSAAYVLTRRVDRFRAPTREAIWYAAIAASLLGASYAVLMPEWGGLVVRLPTPSAGVASTGAGAGPLGWTDPARLLALFKPVWLCVGSALLVQYVARLITYMRSITREALPADRSEVRTLQSVASVAGLKRAPRLTVSRRLGSPIALGIGPRAEICIPEWVVRTLNREQVRALISHEVAHIARRDPMRMALMNVLKAGLFFQPLLRLAHREISDAAEEQCDAWAAEHTHNPTAVARCLTEVARRMLPSEATLSVAGMARGRSKIGWRVDQILANQAGASRASTRSAWIACLVFAMGAPLAGPRVVAPNADISHSTEIEANRNGPSDEDGEHAGTEARAESPTGAPEALALSSAGPDQREDHGGEHLEAEGQSEHR